MEESEKIFDTLNEIREEKFSEIPEKLLKKIIRIEEDHLENDEKAPREISNLVEGFLKESNHQ